ncbi:hypothetical protein [Clostridium cylindrosporum]|uniref:Uncharacterized protein n=1 Tax=Clostridium cylindrosporum DSM 605 TaxID=1121307 RepID=A0A0J8D9Q7_CLOCY|nr:hypothetical protein [Clostridium cylindrosporum]KMT22790.1 hypothetical protein CLCY_5c00290 [Clostridium cylindrosporum DSM 605]
MAQWWVAVAGAGEINKPCLALKDISNNALINSAGCLNMPTQIAGNALFLLKILEKALN